ncbi:hypothetical protein [Chitiniphilus shinanonensis]|uniref:hypothetical protein n=1 Tax=Chitiniphilus shinanonensis TaxID=553088 RepID=UPI00305E99E2
MRWRALSHVGASWLRAAVFVALVSQVACCAMGAGLLAWHGVPLSWRWGALLVALELGGLALACVIGWFFPRPASRPTIVGPQGPPLRQYWLCQERLARGNAPELGEPWLMVCLQCRAARCAAASPASASGRGEREPRACSTSFRDSVRGSAGVRQDAGRAAV